MDKAKFKTGIKTSEFWMALITALVSIGNEHLGLGLSPEVVYVVGGIAISYILGRSFVKK
jgi:hypothetical protein